LSKAAHKALKAIIEKDDGALRLKTKNIIALGLGVYGVGSKVKAAFGLE
jgi:hypothetical protein